MSVLVVGGTGIIGGQVLNRLVQMGAPVRCLTRHPANLAKLAPGVVGHIGDLLRSFSLSHSFNGMEKLFLISPTSRTETKEGLNAVAAAKAAGIKQVVYISMPQRPNSAQVPQIRNKGPVEKAIRESGIGYTIIRPNNLFQNDYWGKAAITLYDVYPQPLGHVGLNRVNVHDVADAAVNALSSDRFDGKEYTLHGRERLTGDTIAEAYSRHFGKPIRYAGDDLENWAAQAQLMMPNWMVQEFKILYHYYQQHGLIATEEELTQQQEIVGHPPREFDDFVAQLANVWLE